jgi:pimeloyl-ACP methyl ester carboxylesterase
MNASAIQLACAFVLALAGLGGCAMPSTGDTPETPTVAPQARSSPPRFVSHACWHVPPAGFTATCGTVAVPENRAKPLTDANRVELAVMLLHRDGATPTSDPLLLLSGGPGDANIDRWFAAWRQYEQFKANGPGPEQYPGYEETVQQFVATFEHSLQDLTHRDLMLLDQRGTGRTEPSLDCGREAPAACYARLLDAGIDLAGYTTTANAADVNDVRLALGYEQINLWSGSYGSRLGLVVVRDFGSGIRSAVFDGISPPHINHLVAQVQMYGQTLDTLFTRCQRDPACDAAYPELEHTFYETVTGLNAQPVRLDLQDSAGTAHAEWISGDEMSQLVWQSMYYRDAIRFLPMLIDDLAHGNTAVLHDVVQRNHAMQSTADDFSEGLFYTIMCAEEAALTTPQELREAATGLNAAIRDGVLHHALDTVAQCEEWRVPPISWDDRRAVHSDVPILLFSGEFDPGTPPAFADAVLAGLRQGYHYVLPGLGHSEIFKSPCRSAVVSEFFNDPGRTPDTRCIATMPRLQFAVHPAEQP